MTNNIDTLDATVDLPRLDEMDAAAEAEYEFMLSVRSAHSHHRPPELAPWWD